MTEDAKVVKTTETTQTTVHKQEQPKTGYASGGPGLLSNVLAIVGFIILIVIVIWGLFHIASLSQPWFSSLFSPTTSSSIQVTAPARVTSGDIFTVSWKYSTSEKGTYAFLYQCKDTVHIDTLGVGNAMNAVPCGAAFTISSTNNTISVLPVLSGTTSTSVSLSILFMPSATTSKQAQGSATVTVDPRVVSTSFASSTSSTVPSTPTKPVTPVTPSKKPVTVTKPPAPVYRGPADISVHIVSQNVDQYGNGVAEFDIGNVGGSSSGFYTFTAQLPTQNGYLYNSPVQASLAPGDHIINTLRFSMAQSGLFSVSVNASDANQSNNYASQSVSMPYYYNNYYPQQYQYPYAY